MRVLDLLRNHDWNIQALISKEEHASAPTSYHVRIEPISGFGLAKETQYITETQAYDHAYIVLNFNKRAK